VDVMAMSQSDKGVWGVGVFALGGALLICAFYSILDNVSKPWIDQTLFLGFFVVPLGFASFFLIGYGLLLILRYGKMG
jgi:TctA family transporter